RQINIIEIHGQDMSSLIGPRGETLNSLQYISRLMVGHQLRQRAGFVIDVENYRQRREQALMRLAERMAHKVAKRKRAIRERHSCCVRISGPPSVPEISQSRAVPDFSALQIQRLEVNEVSSAGRMHEHACDQPGGDMTLSSQTHH
ncbi:MAG: hypothetical protein KDI48_07225, partial [Xanthomonadales bacterium]|nr:hypothetical protein [Xanthomonadales bacterium]